MTSSTPELTILVVDDDPSITRQLESLFGDPAPRLIFADTANAISRIRESDPIQLALIHLHESSLSLLEPLARELRGEDEAVPLLALVDEEPESAAAAAAAGVEGCARMSDERAVRRLLEMLTGLLVERRESRAALKQLHDIEDRYNLLLESSSEAIAYLHEGLHIYANPAYLARFGYAEFADLEGLSILDLLAAGDDGVDLKQLLRALGRGQYPEEPMEIQATRSDGSQFDGNVEFSPARFAGERCTQMMVREKSAGEDRELLDELEKLRTRDLLTGLLNRQSFLEQIHSELQRQGDDRMMAVFLIQLDDHAGLQQKLGPGATDALIRQTAELFHSATREDQLPARLHDHTLAMRAWVDERQEAEQLATGLVESFSGTILEIRDKSLTVTASVGLSLGNSQRTQMEELVGQAESALDEAIRAGGNSYVRFRPRTGDEDGGDLEQWGERIRHALTNKDLRMVALPITSMEDDDFLIREVEARLRVEGSDEILLPHSYLPAAQKAGLLEDLDRELVSNLIVHLRGEGTGAGTRWLLPICAECLISKTFTDWIFERVEADELPPRQLIIGMRESAASDQLRKLQKFTRKFAPRGVEFALLDVGLDSRIEPLLKNLQFNYVKLQQEATAALGKDDQARKKLEALVRAADQHEVKIIAPRVENTSDLASLWQFGITLVQDDFVREEA